MAIVKTPAMILQELTVHHNLSPPEYNVITTGTSGHVNEFLSEVSITLHSGLEVCVIGRGSSKKIAKHDAAHKALDALADKGIHPKDSSKCQPSLVKEAVNCIQTLRDACVDNKLPMPNFVFVSDVGEPHCREFTFKCQVGSMETQATEGSKKQSKQVAAQKMFERIKNILPDIIDEDQEIIPNAITITTVKQDMTTSIVKQHFNLRRHRQNLGFTYEEFEEWFMEPTQGNVEKILNKLELRHEVLNIQARPIILVVNVIFESPLSCFGLGNTHEAAVQDGFKNMHELLVIFLK